MNTHILKFSQELLQALRKDVRSKTCSKGVLIFREGDSYAGPWILCKGSVVLVKSSVAGKEQIVRQIDEGEVFAEVPLFKGVNWYPVNARCATSCELYLLPAEKVRARLASDPALAWSAACALADRITGFRDSFLDVTLADARKRLILYLLRRLEGKPNASLGVVKLGISQQDLALLLGIRPESLSRALSELEREGKLKRLSRQTFQLFQKKFSKDEMEW
jgi:CRP/FNR family transcriptional regulator